jgi:hypothetical protein
MPIIRLINITLLAALLERQAMQARQETLVILVLMARLDWLAIVEMRAIMVRLVTLVRQVTLEPKAKKAV